MLVTLDELKNFLGITTTTDDHSLFELLKTAIKSVEDICGRQFETDDFVEYYDGNGTRFLRLNNYPLLTVDKVYQDLDRVFGEDTLIDSLYIIPDNKSGIIYNDSLPFYKGQKTIKVEYTGGYTISTIPSDLKQAFILEASALYVEAKGGVNAFEGESLTYKPSAFRKQAEKLYQGYIRY